MTIEYGLRKRNVVGVVSGKTLRSFVETNMTVTFWYENTGSLLGLDVFRHFIGVTGPEPGHFCAEKR